MSQPLSVFHEPSFGNRCHRQWLKLKAPLWFFNLHKITHYFRLVNQVVWEFLKPSGRYFPSFWQQETGRHCDSLTLACRKRLNSIFTLKIVKTLTRQQAVKSQNYQHVLA